MPQVPGLTPDVAPSEQGVAGPQLNVPVDAFGGAVGHALEGLGTAVEQGSDRIWQRAVDLQNLNNETEARDADAKYMMQAGLLHADFTSKEGTAAQMAFPDYMQKLQDLRTNIRSGLSNPMAQKMYDASSLSVMGRTIFNGAGHAAQQAKVAASNASQARVDAMSDGIGAAPTDDLTYQRYKRGIESETRNQGNLHGWTPDQTNETVKQNVSGAVAKRIVGLARTDAIGAQGMFERAVKDGDLLPVMADRVQATVETQFRQQGSRVISDRVLADRRAGNEDRTEDEYIADGMKQADAIIKQTGINDPLFKDFVRQRISIDYGGQKRIERDNQQSAEQTVAATMISGNKEGILPRNPDELRLANPAAGPAWDTLPPTTQKKYLREMAHNALGERVAWNDETVQTYKGLKGQSLEDPVNFLARDIISERIPAAAKKELINLQMRMMSQSTQDPRVAQALQTLAPDLNAAGISKASDSESYYQFVGGLQDALDDYHKGHPGKVPGLDDIRTMGARLMQDQLSGRPGWFNTGTFGLGNYGTQETAPLYKLPVPNTEAARIRALPFWANRGIAAPTDAMIQRFYHAEQYKKLYGGSAKKPEAKP